MNDPESKAAPVSPRRRPSWWRLPLVLVLIGLVVAAAFGWRGWQLLRAQLQREQQRMHQVDGGLQRVTGLIGNLHEELGKQSSINQEQGQQLNSIQSRLNDFGNSLSHLDKVISGGSEQVRIGEVEQLLLTANQAVELERNPDTARRALLAADQRLASEDDPKFFAVRKAIASELSALRAVHEPDLTAAALSLSQIIDTSSELPLRKLPKLSRESPTSTGTAAGHNAGGSWLRQIWARVARALGSLFHIRHTSHSIQPTLTAAQEPLIGEILDLRLETARAALLQRRTQVFHASLASALKWLAHYYEQDDPKVSAASAEIRKLETVDLSPALPDVGRSLDILRRIGQNNTASGSIAP